MHRISQMNRRILLQRGALAAAGFAVPTLGSKPGEAAVPPDAARVAEVNRLPLFSEYRYAHMVQEYYVARLRRIARTRRKARAAIVNAIVADGSGTIQATWFNQPYLADQFKRAAVACREVAVLRQHGVATVDQRRVEVAEAIGDAPAVKPQKAMQARLGVGEPAATFIRFGMRSGQAASVFHPEVAMKSAADAIAGVLFNREMPMGRQPFATTAA